MVSKHNNFHKAQDINHKKQFLIYQSWYLDVLTILTVSAVTTRTAFARTLLTIPVQVTQGWTFVATHEWRIKITADLNVRTWQKTLDR